MMMRRILICLLSIFSLFSVKAQTLVKRQLVDAETRTPVAFANIVLKGTTQGTMSDINGYFEIAKPRPSDSLLVSCLGYNSALFSCTFVEANSTLLLKPSTYNLSEINVLPGKNPALAIMEKVVANIPINNPDLTGQYKCLIYHKMVFRYLVNDSTDKKTVVSPKLQAAINNHYLLLMESLSEKRHIAPNKNYEEILTSRVSGFKDPALAVLPVQIQPFVFYDDYLKLIDRQYLNPVSKAGLTEYRFILEDTLTDALGDTIYYISFSPKQKSNIMGVKGAAHIHAPTWAIKSVTATTLPDDDALGLTIKQFYKQTDGKQWFPEQLESSLVMRPKQTSPQKPYPIVAEGKSYVTQINLAPNLTDRDFGMFALNDKSQSPDAPTIERYRYSPLTAKDSLTYLKIDRIGRQKKLDNLLALQRNLIEGYIPIGALKLDYRKLFDYTSFEGLKLGLGLWTGERISRTFSMGGHFVHGFKQHKNNYGLGIKVDVDRERQTVLQASWRDEFAEVGAFSFLDGFKAYSPESFRKYLSETMDRRQDLYLSAESRLARDLKGRLFFNYGHAEPLTAYKFTGTNTVIPPSYDGFEVGTQFRYQPKDVLTNSSLGVISEGSAFPVFWANATYGAGGNDEKYSYIRSEAQINHQTKVSPSQTVAVRLRGGQIWGKSPQSTLYSTFGSYKSFGIDIPHSFSTMQMNEFAGSRFFITSASYSWATNLNNRSKFKPVFELSTKAGWADMQTDLLNGNVPINTFYKGYYESGLAIKKLLCTNFVQYGTSVYYRYGPYAFADNKNNVALMLYIQFAL